MTPGAFPHVVWLDVGCSGVLISEDTLLYAAHCGTDIERVWFGDAVDLEVNAELETARVLNGERSVAVEYCRAHPDAQIGRSSDLAFCRLAEPAGERALLPFSLAACERSALAIGAPVTLVGYGLDPTSGTYGHKRVVEAPLTWERGVLIAGEDARGTCGGDSGGPLFVRTSALQAGWAAGWRLAGILTSGESDQLCGSGRYVDVTRALDWIEAETQRDLSPCEQSDRSWAATPRCRAPALDEEGLPIDREPALFSDTCGAAFDLGVADDTPPRIRAVSVDPHLVSTDAASENTAAENTAAENTAAENDALDISVDASDVGTGIDRVSVELLSAQGRVLSSQHSEVAPYVFTAVPVPPQASQLLTSVTDYAGLVTVRSQTLSSPSGGCSVSVAKPCRFAPLSGSVLTGLLAALLGLRRLASARRAPRSVVGRASSFLRQP